MNAFGRALKTSVLLTRLADTVVAECFGHRSILGSSTGAASRKRRGAVPSKQSPVACAALPDRESGQTLLAGIFAGLRQPQWRVALVPLIERLSAKDADFHAPRACFVLYRQN